MIQGTYLGDAVTRHLDPSTRWDVISLGGEFISLWRLNPSQLSHVLRHGGLGGG